MDQFPFQAVIRKCNDDFKTVILKVGWSKKHHTKVGELPNGTVVEVSNTADHESCVAYFIRFDPDDNVDKVIEECPGIGWVKRFNVTRHLERAPPPPPLPSPGYIKDGAKKQKKMEYCGVWGMRPAEDFGSASASSISTTPITAEVCRVRKDGVAIFNPFGSNQPEPHC